MILFEMSCYKNNFLHVMAVFDYLPKLKMDPGLASGTHFVHDFPIKMLLI